MANSVTEKIKKLLLPVLLGLSLIFAEIDYGFSQQNALSNGSLINGPDIEIIVKETQKKITIDGRLDDPAWATAAPYENYFFQQEPHDREPSSEKTRVMVLQDIDTIYFGIQAYYKDPNRIIAAGMRRDKDVMTGDNVELLIDTFRDNRNCYAFVTNPLSGEQDAIISDEGNDINKSWDCVWRVKSAANGEGWSAEIAIPFKSLKFRAGETGEWGLNITRNIKYNNETTYLVPIPRGLGHNGKFKGELFASLKNIKLPSQRLNLSVQPYVRSGGTWIRKPEHKDDSEFDGGFDVRYHVTPQLMLDATYNTDFAQIESEEEVVNVTRFNVYLPEKRDFFLENAGLFNFSMVSSAGEYYARDADFILFSSRTIGIQDGKRTPLYGGGKFAGRSGPYSIGVMNIQSEETALDDGSEEPSTNFTAVRFKRDFRTNSYIGLMALNKQSETDDFSRTLGVDGYYAFSQELYVKGSVARTLEKDDEGDDIAGDVKVVLNKDWIDFSAAYTSIDSLFKPEMGYVRRENIRKTDSSVELTKWINNRYLRNISWQNSIGYTTDHENVLQTRENSSGINVDAASGDGISYSINHDYEYLPEDDYIRDIRVDEGTYSATYHKVSASSYGSRPVSGSVSYRWGELFEGDGRTLSCSGKVRSMQRLITELSYTYNHLDLTNGALYANVFAGRWTYSFTTNMFAKCYIQWNDADEKIATNLLFDYIYRPKSHLYIVYNENRDSTNGSSQTVRDRMLQLKLTYLWNI
ncbi:MAG: carbohydrate binding family 9 domain-containing protein [Candidatus Latescibacteria bacterium]|nr:carbohydrate binding family 9 domain-containing protein [Candidatus Latescibacterota bacterium]